MVAGEVRTAPRAGRRPLVLGLASFAGAAGATLLIWARGYPFPDLSNAYAVVFGWSGVVVALGLVLWAARLRQDPGSPEQALAGWGLSALAILVGMTAGWWVAEQALLVNTAGPPEAFDGAALAPAQPATGPGPAPAGAGCDGAHVTSDIDGDGQKDQVLVVPAPRRPALRVCLATGEIRQADALGMGETLAASDVDGDGVTEILVGVSTAASEAVYVAVWHDGGPWIVADPTGGPLELARGGGGTYDGHLWSMQSVWGCADRDGDGNAELVDARARLDGEHYLATITGYRLDGHRAHIATRDELGLDATPQPFNDLGIHACDADQ